MTTTQATGKTPDCPFAQWFFEGASIMGTDPLPVWTDEEMTTLNATMIECLEAWQASQGHYWNSNFYRFTKYGNGDLYTAHKPTWQSGGLSARTPEGLAKEIRKQFR